MAAKKKSASKAEEVDEVKVLTPKEKQAKLKNVLNSFAKKNPDIQITDGTVGIETVPSGVFVIDRLTKHFPKGQYTHIAGPSGVGKTSFAYALIASLQKEGNTCVIINNERRYSAAWAAKLGVDVSALVVINATDLENGLDAIIMLSKSGLCDVLVVDTLTSLASRGEVKDKKGDRSTADHTMALIPRQLSKFFRIATPYVHNSQMVVLLLNQIRKDLGSLFVKDIATGGNALEHSKTLDIFMRRGAKKDWPTTGTDKEYIGHIMHLSLLKCTHSMDASEGDVTTLNFIHGEGFDNELDIAYHARLEELVIKTPGKKGSYQYTDKSGELHMLGASIFSVDQKMKDMFIEKKLMDEVRIRLLTNDLENIGEIEKITLDEDAENG